jgi:hypothetical protein
MAEINIPAQVPEEDPAHVAAMLAKVDGVTPAAPATPATPDAPQRPAWLPEKFATPEAMAEAYAALEQKQGSQKPADAPAAAEAEATAAKAVEAAGLDMSALEAEITSGGDLSAESYEALAKVGISKDVVGAYIEGQKAIGAQIMTRMHEAVGGEETFNSLAQWAAQNVPADELEAFNNIVDTGTESAIRMALQGLHSRYVAAGQNKPNLMGGQRASANGDVFRSIKEVTTAMADRRYSTDPAYRADVEAKLSRSSVL